MLQSHGGDDGHGHPDQQLIQLHHLLPHVLSVQNNSQEDFPHQLQFSIFHQMAFEASYTTRRGEGKLTFKQAGAELCQAQVRLRLDWLYEQTILMMR